MPPLKKGRGGMERRGALIGGKSEEKIFYLVSVTVSLKTKKQLYAR